MVFKKLLSLIRLLVRAELSMRYAKKRDMCGLDFGYFGRQLGVNLLMKLSRRGYDLLLTPVNIIRYFEFPFAWSCLPNPVYRCLDIGSPRLFSLFVAQKYPSVPIIIINPDPNDISQTKEIISRINLKNITLKCASVDTLQFNQCKFDCIWSISVLEHIHGEYDDKFAVKLMYDALSEGGRLIITVPVDRTFWTEYRDHDYYATQGQKIKEKYFFQNLYDKNAVWERLVAPIGREPSVVRWFGETVPGRFAEYEQRWMRDGQNCSVDDPREICDYYREFSSWEEMPGLGVCGLTFEK